MPKVLTFGEFVLFFWIAENGEPVHVHVAIRRPTENATKFWLTSMGGCILANNNSGLSKHDLRDISKLIVCNHALICQKWAQCFGADSLIFYR